MAVVLLVEDRAVHRSATGYFLRRRGHEVVPAAGGAEAVERLGHWRPDVILLDLAVPDLDGLGVLAALGRTPGRQMIPVIVAIAAADAGMLAVARELGAGEVLVKGEFPLTALADAIGRALHAGGGGHGQARRRAPAEGSPVGPNPGTPGR
jgi:CheY-like chemotaxis protein